MSSNTNFDKYIYNERLRPKFHQHRLDRVKLTSDVLPLTKNYFW